MKKGALAVSCLMVVVSLFTDLLWIFEFADGNTQVAFLQLFRGETNSALGLQFIDLVSLIFMLISALVKMLLVLAILKALVSVALPPKQQLAWQQKVEEEWMGRCTLV